MALKVISSKYHSVKHLGGCPTWSQWQNLATRGECLQFYDNHKSLAVAPKPKAIPYMKSEGQKWKSLKKIDPSLNKSDYKTFLCKDTKNSVVNKVVKKKYRKLGDCKKIVQKAYQHINNNQAVEVELVSSKNSKFKVKYTCKCKKHLENWLEKVIADEVETLTGYNTTKVQFEDFHNPKEVELFKYASINVTPVTAGCNKKNYDAHYTIAGTRMNINVLSLKSQKENCAFKVIDHFLGTDINVKDYRFKKKLKGKLSPEEFVQIYNEHKSDDDLPVRIYTSHVKNLDEGYNHVLYHKEHYTVIENLKPKPKDINKDGEKRTGCKRGKLFWDIEAREDRSKYVEIGKEKTKSYQLQDSITHTHYKPYKAKEYTDVCYETNPAESSCRQFIDFLNEAAENRKFYNCYGHYSSGFDLYFLIKDLTEEEWMDAEIKMRGKNVIKFIYKQHRFVDSWLFMPQSLASLCSEKNYNVSEGKMTEIELDDENQHVLLPLWVKEEVSHLKEYYNSELQKNPYKEWT